LRFTFKKTDRILKRSDFLALAEHGHRLQNDVFIVVVLPGKTGRSRLGITVTRKVGGAVKRNRIKRLVREFFRRDDFRREGNWDVNIIAKKKAAELPSDTIFSALKSLFAHLARHLEQNKC
jgi:ribonuclease P protein component